MSIKCNITLYNMVKSDLIPTLAPPPPLFHSTKISVFFLLNQIEEGSLTLRRVKKTSLLSTYPLPNNQPWY